MSVIQSGPVCVRNWRAYNSRHVVRSIVEYPLYTDARITGELIEGYGPYSVLNAVPIEDRPGVLQPCIVLRAHLCLDNRVPLMQRTDESHYHGGSLQDEIAALSSLCLGVRIKAGNASRMFDASNDPLGRPLANGFRRDPSMTLGTGRLKVPSCVGNHSITDLAPLAILPSLSTEQAVAIIRSAKLYQDALMICESEPSLSWLMLVSALETAANQWRKDDDSPVRRLEASKPNLFKILKESGVPDLPEMVSNEIVDSLGATSKFIKFVKSHFPDPPQLRPPERARIEWTSSAFKGSLGMIYKYRSRALHAGIPFPDPMCDDGLMVDGCLAEKPMALSYASLGGVWMADDIPMMLHTFAHITRGALLKWINSMRIRDDHMMDRS